MGLDCSEKNGLGACIVFGGTGVFFWAKGGALTVYGERPYLSPLSFYKLASIVLQYFQPSKFCIVDPHLGPSTSIETVWTNGNP